MNVSIEHFEDADLKARFESGERIPYAQEKFRFEEDDRAVIFTLDSLRTTTFRTIKVGAQTRFVETIDRAIKSQPCLALLEEALVYLREQRAVEQVNVYNRPMGQYQSYSIDELIILVRRGKA